MGLGWGMAEGIRRAEVPKGAAEARKAAAEELQAPLPMCDGTPRSPKACLAYAEWWLGSGWGEG